MSKEKWKDIGERAIKTVCQTASSMLVIGQGIFDVDWISVISVSLVAGLISVLTNIGGTSEVKEK